MGCELRDVCKHPSLRVGFLSARQTPVMATTMVGVLVSETLHVQSAGKLSMPIWRRQSRTVFVCRDRNMQ